MKVFDSAAKTYSIPATHVVEKKKGARTGHTTRVSFSFFPVQARPGGGETPEYECSKIVRPLVRDEFATREENGCVCVCARAERRERRRPAHFVSAVAFSQVICDNDGARVPLGKRSVPPFVFIVLDLGWLGSTSAIYRIYIGSMLDRRPVGCVTRSARA